MRAYPGLFVRSLSAALLFFAVSGHAVAQSCVPPPEGLIAWWPGDGDASDIVGGRDGTLVGGAGFAAGKVDQAFSFDGNGFVSIPDDPLWTLGDNAFTVDLWVRFNSIGVNGRHTFVGHSESGGEFNKWIFWFDEFGHVPSPQFVPALRFHVNSPSVPPTDTTVAPWAAQVGTWYHVAVTREGSTYKLFIDGVNVVTDVDANTIPDPGVPLTIGGAEGLNIDGMIDEVEIFNRALSDQEIASLHSADSAGKCKTAELQVTIDIKPGSDPNCFNINGNGVVPVAILGSDTLDVNEVDSTTLSLAGLKVRVRGNRGPQCSTEYVDADQFLDLVCQFEDDPNNWTAGNDSFAELTGALVDGAAIKGADSICVVP